MKTDQRTKKELSIFNGKVTLLSYFDHINLAQSKSKLRSMLKQPLLSYNEIIQRQNLLKYFQKHEKLAVK